MNRQRLLDGMDSADLTPSAQECIVSILGDATVRQMMIDGITETDSGINDGLEQKITDCILDDLAG